MTTANQNLPFSAPMSKINRRAVLAGGAFTAAPATAGAATAGTPIFAPSALRREMIALTREYRALLADVDDLTFDQFMERIERFAKQILAEPLSASNLVDLGFAAQFSAQDELSAAWLPDRTQAIDVHDCKDGAIVAILALAGLPIECKR